MNDNVCPCSRICVTSWNFIFFMCELMSEFGIKVITFSNPDSISVKAIRERLYLDLFPNSPMLSVEPQSETQLPV